MGSTLWPSAGASAVQLRRLWPFSPQTVPLQSSLTWTGGTVPWLHLNNVVWKNSGDKWKMKTAPKSPICNAHCMGKELISTKESQLSCQCCWKLRGLVCGAHAHQSIYTLKSEGIVERLLPWYVKYGMVHPLARLCFVFFITFITQEPKLNDCYFIST